MIKKVLFIGVCIFAFASCSTVKPLYSWYNYEDITAQLQISVAFFCSIGLYFLV